MKDEEKILLQTAKGRLQEEIAILTELAVETEQVEALPALSVLLDEVNKITCEIITENYMIQQLSFKLLRLAIGIRDTASQTGG